MSEELDLKFLGGVQISQGSVPLAEFAYAKSQALLAYLSITGRPHSREALAGLLWGGAPDDVARKNLREVLHDLRRFVQSHLIITHETVAFDLEAPYRLDVETLLACFEGPAPCIAYGDVPRLRAAVEAYRGDLLEGFYVHDAPEFEEWLLGQRERLRQLALQALHELAVHYTERGEYSLGIDYITRLLALDRTREDAHRQLMLLLARSDQREAALAQYKTCRHILAEELGVEPSDETQALERQIEVGDICPDARVGRPRHNLPVPPTPLLGREKELSLIMRKLDCDSECRLLTLVGAGGIGKTRLGLQAAVHLMAAQCFADGVFMVTLAPINGADLVISGIAQALDVRESSGQSLLESVKDFLRYRQMLLVLDNFEHVIAAAPIVAQLLAACASLKVLVTSHEALRVQGEHLLPVPPLALPPLIDLAAPLLRYPVVQLFVQRVQAVKPDFALNGQNARAVAEICYRLDGLPLAIELAAAHVRVLTPHRLLAELSHRLDFLTGGPRDLPARQQTLRNTIDWSYNLLTPEQQRLFRRLSVFAGGCTLETIETVCTSATGVVGLADLEALVDQHLVNQIQGDDEPRFTMLETIREYASEKLDGSGEAGTLRARHLDVYLELAETATPELAGNHQAEWLDRLEAEHDNLRAALSWALACGAVEPALRLSAALGFFWNIRGYMSEGREWLARALEAGSASAQDASRESQTYYARAQLEAGRLAFVRGEYAQASDLIQECVHRFRAIDEPGGIADSLNLLGVIAREQGDYAGARKLYEESLALRLAIPDPLGVAQSLNNLGTIARIQGDLGSARRLHEESLTLARELQNKAGMALSLNSLGDLAIMQGDYVLARQLIEESLEFRRQVGYRVGIAGTLSNLGNLALAEGNLAEAWRLHEESVALRRELGYRVGIAAGLQDLGLVALRQGNYSAARACLTESLSLNRELGTRWGIALTLACWAGLVLGEGSPQRAVILAGAVASLCDSLGARLDVMEQQLHDQTIGAARMQLGDAAFQAMWGKGLTLSLEQVIAYALETTS